MGNEMSGRSRTNRHARGNTAGLLERLEELRQNPEHRHLQTNIDLLDVCLSEMVERWTLEDLVNPLKIAIYERLSLSVARLKESQGRIESQERYVATPQALRNFCDAQMELVIDCLEQAAGPDPSEESARALGDFYRFFQAGMERKGVGEMSQGRLAAAEIIDVESREV